MPKMNKKELGAMGKRIMTKAKAISKANPRKKWTSIIKSQLIPCQCCGKQFSHWR